MISLTTLLASATVAAAAKKVEDAPAPGVVDTVLGFIPSWLGGPVAQVFDKGVETLGCVLGWITAGPQVVADVVAAWKSTRREIRTFTRGQKSRPRAIRPAPARVFSSTSLPPTTPDVNSKEHSVCRVQPSRPAQTDVSLFSQKENGKKFGCIAVV